MNGSACNCKVRICLTLAKHALSNITASVQQCLTSKPAALSALRCVTNSTSQRASIKVREQGRSSGAVCNQFIVKNEQEIVDNQLIDSCLLLFQLASFYGFRPKNVRFCIGERMFLVWKLYVFGTETVEGRLQGRDFDRRQKKISSFSEFYAKTVCALKSYL